MKGKIRAKRLLRKVMKRLSLFLIKRKRVLLFSTLFSIVLLFLTYDFVNAPIPIGGERALLKKVEFGRKLSGNNKQAVPDSLLLINVAYDKVINENPYYDEQGNEAGHIPIVDREKLRKLLKQLKKWGDYKYVLLDVFFAFEDGETVSDRELFSTILTMDHIVVPYLIEGERIRNTDLLKKAGFVDYYETHFKVGFSKYIYLMDNQPSLALKMYQDVTNRDIKKHGPFYTDGGRLAKRCNFLAIDIKATSAYKNIKTKGKEDVQKVWYNLGLDLLELLDNQPDSLHKLTDGKYIVIGAFHGDDEHSTFQGKVPGSVVNFNAFAELMKGNHLISPFFVVFLFLFFFSLTFFTLCMDDYFLKKADLMSKSEIKYLRWSGNAMKWLFSWISYALLLSVFCVFFFLCFRQTHEILVTSTIFYILSKIYKRSNRFQSWIKNEKRTKCC